MIDQIVTVVEFIEAIDRIHPNSAVAWDRFQETMSTPIECARFILQTTEAPLNLLKGETLVAVASPLNVNGGFCVALYIDASDPLGVHWRQLKIGNGVTFLDHPPGFKNRDEYNAHLVQEKLRRAEFDRILAAEQALRRAGDHFK